MHINASKALNCLDRQFYIDKQLFGSCSAVKFWIYGSKAWDLRSLGSVRSLTSSKFDKKFCGSTKFAVVSSTKSSIVRQKFTIPKFCGSTKIVVSEFEKRFGS